MASTYKIAEMTEGVYQVIGKSEAYITNFGTTYILSVKNLDTNIGCQIFSNAYLTEYIQNNEIPRGGFKMTIRKDIKNKSIIDIENYSKIILF